MEIPEAGQKTASALPNADASEVTLPMTIMPKKIPDPDSSV